MVFEVCCVPYYVNNIPVMEETQTLASLLTSNIGFQPGFAKRPGYRHADPMPYYN